VNSPWSGWLQDRRLVGWVSVGIALAIITDSGVMRGGLWVALSSATIVALILLISFGPLRLNAGFWLLFLLPVRDLHSSVGEMATGWSIWRDGLGPLSTSPLILSLLIWSLVRHRPTKLSKLDRVWWLYFLIVVPFATRLFTVGGEFLPAAFITDLKFPILIGVSLQLFSNSTGRFGPQSARRVALIAVVLLVSRHLVDFLYFVGGVETTMLGSVNRVSVDSAKSLVILVLVGSLFLTVRRRGGLEGLLGATIGSALLLAYQTRFLFFTLVLSMGVMFLSLPLRRWIGPTVLSFALGGAAFVSFQTFFPKEVAVSLGRWGTLASQVQVNRLAAVTDVRVLGIINSQAEVWGRGAVLTGKGYGASYSDRFAPFGPLDVSSFPQDQISTGRFFRVHEMTFHLLFKFGAVGLALFLVLFAHPGRAVWRRCRDSPSGRQVPLALPLLLSAVPVVAMNLFWTSKGLVLTGYLIALLRAESTAARAAPAPMKNGSSAA
jgi:hypothetical protein